MRDVSVIIPTYNEADNIPILLARLADVLKELNYEVIIVDDNSPDGTHEVAGKLAEQNERIHMIRRFTDRGLSSAVVAGMAAAQGRVLVVMDADLQHDETIIPQMVDCVAAGDFDLAVGSRGIEGGSYGEWSRRRRFASGVAAGLARLMLPIPVRDPMSGFFAVTREAYQATAPDIDPRGFKILLEFIGRNRKLRVTEIGYTFRNRVHGQTKLSASVVRNYLIALWDLRFGRLVSHTFALYGIVGLTGVVVNLVGYEIGILLDFPRIYTGLSPRFDPLITAAPFGYQLAILSNFVLNNYVTFYEQRKRGWGLLSGFLVFQLVSIFGLLVHVAVFQLLQVNGFLTSALSETLRGLANNGLAVIAALVSNYYLNLNFTWQGSKS